MGTNNNISINFVIETLLTNFKEALHENTKSIDDCFTLVSSIDKSIPYIEKHIMEETKTIQDSCSQCKDVLKSNKQTMNDVFKPSIAKVENELKIIQTTIHTVTNQLDTVKINIKDLNNKQDAQLKTLFIWGGIGIGLMAMISIVGFIVGLNQFTNP